MTRYFFLLLAAIGIMQWSINEAEARPAQQGHRTFRIVAFGDAFTAGYGLEPMDAYPTVLRRHLNEEFPRDRIEVVNAGVSGDTAATAVSRLASILAEKPDIVIVAFGYVDALRGVDPNITYKALDQILSTLTHNNIYVMLAGYRAPLDANIEYAARFNAIFPEMAKRYNVVYYPFMLKGVANDPYMLQFDGVHPNEDGMIIMTKNIYDHISQMIRRVRARLL